LAFQYFAAVYHTFSEVSSLLTSSYFIRKSWHHYLWFRALQIYFIMNNQWDAAWSSLIYYLLRDHSTRFGCSLHPSSVVHKTVVTTTGTSRVSEWCGLKSVKSCQYRVSTSHSEVDMDFNPQHSDTQLVC
jgi:hypothetical protein